jgi:hypothetical protein
MDPRIQIQTKMSRIRNTARNCSLQVMCRMCEKPVERDVFYRSHIRRHHQLREEDYVAKERLEYLPRLSEMLCSGSVSFWASRSGSVISCTDLDPSINKQKKVQNYLNFNCFVTS